MCGALCECLKCPGKVVCCCCKCAFNMLCGAIISGLVLIIVIGLIVYFTVFYNKDNGGSDNDKKLVAQKLIDHAPENFRDYFKHLQ